MTEFDQELLKWHNQMRTDPKSFIEELEAFNKTFSGKQVTIKIGEKDVTLNTNEGTKPVTELIEFLKEQEPLEPLSMNEALRNASCLHVQDQGLAGEEGHKSTNGSTFAERMREGHLNRPGFLLAENIAYGSSDAKSALLTLAIDDGVPSRGHRKNIFAAHFRQVGICNGKHKLLQHMAVLIYRGKTAKEFGPDGKKDTASAEI